MFKLCVVNLMHTSFQATKLQPNPKSELCVLTDTFRCVSSLTVHTSLHCGPTTCHILITAVQDATCQHVFCWEYIPYCCIIMSLGCLLMYITVHTPPLLCTSLSSSYCQDNVLIKLQISAIITPSCIDCVKYLFSHHHARESSLDCRCLLSNLDNFKFRLLIKGLNTRQAQAECVCERLTPSVNSGCL